MENVQRTAGWPLRGLACAFAGGALLLAGCGGGSDYKNVSRPPAPINVSAFVSPNRVSVSPARFGAGPIVVIVANQSNASQEVTFQNDGASGSGSNAVRQSTLISPGATGTLKLEVQRGAYLVKTGDDSITPASVTVGPERPSAQNQLLEP
jgi:hypothetical protein